MKQRQITMMKKAFALALLAAAFVLSAGCQSAMVEEPLTNAYGGSDMDSQSEFWFRLSDRPVVSNDEAFHALLLYTDGEDPGLTYDQRVATLKERKMLPQGFNEPANQSVRRGDIAVATCRLLEIKGGLTMRVFGPNFRYSTRELEYMGIYPTSSPYQTFTGSQFTALLGRIEDIQRIRGVTSLQDEEAPDTIVPPVPPQVPDRK